MFSNIKDEKEYFKDVCDGLKNKKHKIMFSLLTRLLAFTQLTNINLGVDFTNYILHLDSTTFIEYLI